jgi:hypothetical protein
MAASFYPEPLSRSQVAGKIQIYQRKTFAIFAFRHVLSFLLPYLFV